jgi:hypothetical protein
MLSDTIHIIQHAVVDVHYNGTTDGFALQKEVQDWFEELMVELNSQFNSVVMTDEIISIDSLQLEVDVNSRHWKKEATKQILFQVLDKIMLLRSGSVVTKAFKTVAPAKHLEDEFLFYLQHGYLSWKSSVIPATEWKQKVNLLFEKAGRTVAEKLYQQLKVNSNAILRLNASVPGSLLLRLFATLFSNETAYQTTIKDFSFLHQIIQSNKNAEDAIIVAFLNIVAHWPNYSYTTHAVHNLFTRLVAEKIISKKEIQSTVFLSPVFLEQQKIITVHQSTKKKLLSQEKTEIIQEAKPKPKTVIQLAGEQPTKGISETDGIFISNAGLVIVAAFLPALFQKLQFYNGAIIQNNTQAVCLLHVIATGKKPNDELELVLPKILCGVHPENFIDVRKFRMQQVWKNEIQEVLTSVIEYWNIVGNTSVDGIRESFLQRKGKLMYKESGWILQVEQQPYDMLLQHLPWNISMIQLPWMKQMLQTEWIF